MKCSLYSLLTLLLLASCKPSPSGVALADQLPEDFVTFYLQFHADSAFQMNHIDFPLPGLPAEADSATIHGGQYFWHEETWILHKPVDYASAGFRQEIFPLGETLMVEYMTNDYGYRIQRRFSKRNNRWVLSYYEDLNKLSSHR